MDKRIVRPIVAALMGLASFCGLYVAHILSNQDEITKSYRLASLLLNVQSEILENSSKSEGCVINGPLPDPACTPGAVFPEATVEQICVPGYTKTVRSVSESLKRKIYTAYGIDYPQEFGSYEADHLIPLALGGNNDFANLFPEAADPKPGFKEKDVVENYLHEEVCAGRIDLAAAQVQIAHNWVAIYENMPSKTVERLRAKYKSWAPNE